jgi:hypothetical protein
MADVNSPSVNVIMKVLVEKDIATDVAGAGNYVRRYS